MKKSAVCVLLAFVLLITGCKDDSIETSSDSESNLDVDDTTGKDEIIEEDSNKEDEKKEDPYRFNPLKLENYTYFPENPNLDENEDAPQINVRATIGSDYDAKSYFTDFSLISSYDNFIIIGYTLVTDMPNSDFEGGQTYTHYVALVELKNDSENEKEKSKFDIVKEIKVGENYSSNVFRQFKDSVFYVNCSSEDKCKTTVYDKKLEEKFSFEHAGMYGAVANEDMSCFYYAEEGNLFCYDVATATVSQIETVDKFNDICVNGIITKDSQDYVLIYAKAYNELFYHAFISVKDGTTIKIFDDKIGSVGAYVDNTISFDNYGNKGIEYYVFDRYMNMWNVEANKPLNYSLNVLDSNEESNRYILMAIDEYNISMEMYDNARFIDKTTLLIEPKSVGDESEYADMAELFMVGNFLDDGQRVLFFCRDGYGNSYVIEWKYKTDIYVDSDVETPIDTDYQVTRFEIDDIEDASLNLMVELEEYRPSPLSEKLLPLREKADEMEQEYGLEIEIGQPCCDIIGGYAIEALTDYILVNDALEELRVQLEKYPDNFFRQFSDESCEGLEIYLAGTLKGVSDDGLDYAGGFQNDYHNGYMIMVIDARSASDVAVTFNHELCHSIEDRINLKGFSSDEFLLDDNKWDEFNPPECETGSFYTSDYGKFGYDENLKYTYFNMFEANENTYFIDDYSMTFPSEDRARLFEEVMASRYNVDFEKAPHLREKMKYYSECIREVFDTTGWENVYWERFN